MTAIIEVSHKVMTRPLPMSNGRVKHALSKQTSEIEQSAEDLKNRPSPSSLRSSPETKEQEVFSALATAKIRTAEVAMHLPREWRQRLFNQLDSLHETDEWEQGDKPVKELSFRTFLRFVVAMKVTRRPGLGLSPDGNLLTSWSSLDGTLTLEFLPADKVQWVVSRVVDEEKERAAGVTAVRRLTSVLAPFVPKEWLHSEG